VDSTGGYIVGILILILFSAFFSASEIAYTSVNVLRLKKSADGGNKWAQLAMRVHDRYEHALTTILIGNNLVNIAASSLATLIAITVFGEGATGIAGILITILLLMFGEITPKTVAKHNCDKFVLFAAAPLRVMMLIMSPVILVVNRILKLAARIWNGKEKEEEQAQPTITEQEFQQILEMVEDEGVIDEDTTQLMQSALEFDDITVGQVLTPRIEMAAFDIDDGNEDLLKLILDTQFSRIPVYEETIDQIIGILPSNHFLREMDMNGTADIRSLLVKPVFLHKTMRLDDALQRLRVARTYMAVVTDEYGGTLGIVTMEDLLEQLVGDIWDETDDIVEECIKVSEDTYACAGTMSIHEFFDEIDYEDKDFESAYTTLGGWAIEMLDAQPEAGKSFVYDRLTVTVAKMDKMRVDRLTVKVAPEEEEEDAL
jgi:putative hemolysin